MKEDTLLFIMIFNIKLSKLEIEIPFFGERIMILQGFDNL
jgi:hypothetical protein